MSVAAEHPMQETRSLRDYDRIFLVENFDESAGLCAHITFALNGIKFALEKNWLPVIRFDRPSDALYDPEYGSNVWDYYFEPPLGYTHADVRARVDSGEIHGSQLLGLEDLVPPGVTPLSYQMDLHHGIGLFRRFDRIATFSYGERRRSGKRLPRWMARKRALGREFTSRFIRVKSHVLDKVEDFFESHMNGRRVFGAHVRGTDLDYALPAFPSRYFEILDGVLAEEPEALLFLATDQEQYRELFLERYGERVLSYDCTRSRNATAPHLAAGVPPYQLGEEALIDCLLLSRTQHIVKCAASAGEYALYFNPDLDCTDLALESAWTPHTKEGRPVAGFLRWRRSRERMRVGAGLPLLGRLWPNAG
jgi:hypothetical protein